MPTLESILILPHCTVLVYSDGTVETHRPNEIKIFVKKERELRSFDVDTLATFVED